MTAECGSTAHRGRPTRSPRCPRRRRSRRRAHIIELAGTAIGYLELAAEGERTRIKTIAIVQAHRRAGIGSEVVAHVARTHEPMVLRVLKANTEARRLYERLGFAVVGESEHYWWEMHLPRE